MSSPLIRADGRVAYGQYLRTATTRALAWQRVAWRAQVKRPGEREICISQSFAADRCFEFSEPAQICGFLWISIQSNWPADFDFRVPIPQRAIWLSPLTRQPGDLFVGAERCLQARETGHLGTGAKFNLQLLQSVA